MKFNDAMYAKVGLGPVITDENQRLVEQAKRLPQGEVRLEGRVSDDHRNIPEQRRLAGITRHEREPQAAHGGMPIYRANGAGMFDDNMQSLYDMGVRPNMRRLFENSPATEVRMPPIRSKRPPRLKFMVTSMERDGVNVDEEKLRVAEMLRRQGYDVVEVEEDWTVQDAPGQEDMDASRDMEDRAIARDAKKTNARRHGRHNESSSLIKRRVITG